MVSKSLYKLCVHVIILCPPSFCNGHAWPTSLVHAFMTKFFLPLASAVKLSKYFSKWRQARNNIIDYNPSLHVTTVYVS